MHWVKYAAIIDEQEGSCDTLPQMGEGGWPAVPGLRMWKRVYLSISLVWEKVRVTGRGRLSLRGRLSSIYSLTPCGWVTLRSPHWPLLL